MITKYFASAHPNSYSSQQSFDAALVGVGPPAGQHLPRTRKWVQSHRVPTALCDQQIISLQERAQATRVAAHSGVQPPHNLANFFLRSSLLPKSGASCSEFLCNEAS